MSYTFSIKKDRWDPILEVKIKEEIMEYDLLVHSYLEKCFERVFQLIKQTVKEKKEGEEKVDTEIEDGESNERNFFSIFN